MIGEDRSSATPKIITHSSILEQGRLECFFIGFLGGSLSSTGAFFVVAVSTFSITTHSLPSTSSNEGLLSSFFYSDLNRTNTVFGSEASR